MVRVSWKLRDYLRVHDISVQELARAMGGSRVATLYRLTSPTDPPSRIDLPTLAAVIGTLRRMTGETVAVADVFEIEEAPSPEEVDALLWSDATLHPLLEPDAHGRLDPDELGEPLHFEPERGWTGGDDR